MKLTLENELILLCSQIRIPPDKQVRVKELLVLDLKWEKVLTFAFSSGLAPLMYHSLKDFEKSFDLPSDFMKQLKEGYYQNIARNTYQYEELRRIHQSFTAEGIDFIVLKGFALACTVFKNSGLRVFKDIDILVKKKDLSAAEIIMEGLDYNSDYSETVIDHYKNNHHHLAPFFHPTKGTIVEIHSNITPDFNFDIDECWKNAKETCFNNLNALIFAPEDMLIHLCLHLFSSGNTGNTLRGIYDIAETLNFYSRDIDWHYIHSQAEKYNFTKELNSILFASQQLYGIPEKKINLFYPEKTDFLLVSMIKKIAFSHDKTVTYPGSLVKAMAGDCFSENFKVLIHKVFPDRKTMSIIYNTPINSVRFYFSYIQRLFYLFNRYSKFFFIFLLNSFKQIFYCNFRSDRKI